MQKTFDSKRVYDKKYLKNKMKYYDAKCKTNFHCKEAPSKIDTKCIYLPVILIDSVFKTYKNYHSQAFLGECKYGVK